MKPYEIRDQPSNAQITENIDKTDAKQEAGRTGPIDGVKRDESDQPGENASVNDPKPPFSKSGK